MTETPNSQNQPPTDPPPASTPPAESTPPAGTPEPKPPVVVQSGQPDFSPLLNALGALPEKVANAVREQIPQAPPAPQAPKAGDQSTGGNTQQTPTKAQQAQQTPQTGQATGRRSFAQWWTGAPKKVNT